MDDRTSSRRWSLPWLRTEAEPAPPRNDDWADLGTAFGLDLSLTPLEFESEARPDDRRRAVDEPRRP